MFYEKNLPLDCDRSIHQSGMAIHMMIIYSSSLLLIPHDSSSYFAQGAYVTKLCPSSVRLSVVHTFFMVHHLMNHFVEFDKSPQKFTYTGFFFIKMFVCMSDYL